MKAKKEYKTKGGTFTDNDLDNPTPEMKKSFWYWSACADRYMASKNRKFYKTAEEALDDIYGKDGYEVQ
jgi:hypothetical protein